MAAAGTSGKPMVGGARRRTHRRRASHLRHRRSTHRRSHRK